ncbi:MULTISPECIES: flagellar basal body P-ring formation chaperone FlgA [Alphaproteobacteria]|uniref:Flagella basal body P-ring formation protein FlgA n=2 Tax=Alphaproteobacteria TaxID=28211 RepID=A0A512HDB6_9HYPH|nr:MULTISPECIES: flagellar basal body P-ring formation chaperone FlgA [Alphaproteobacteria]GEO83442.1 flagellar protein FlgA [Ciceribacter naphthalenivorans]GLR24408.1 flagellar protein FlgA [Ciceribacter naphthalenivorans]GLT07264.1 flagellar protein FlgA [Sphingomonas psychrolutea]
MTFRRIASYLVSTGTALAVGAALWAAPGAACAEGFAVVATQTIYPGETVSAAQLKEVEVTNPNLAGGYAKSISEVDGMVSKRTLLPGRTIPVASLRPPYAINRGANIRLTFTLGNMTISASGTPLSDALVGDVIKVRNLDSGVIVTGTVLADGTVQVMAK